MYSLGERTGIPMTLENSSFLDKISPSAVTKAPKSPFFSLAYFAEATWIRSRVRIEILKPRRIASLKMLGMTARMFLTPIREGQRIKAEFAEFRAK
ncbi:MAG: hypothetical protein ACUVWK_07590 [Nitrososphaerales archaeon]